MNWDKLALSELYNDKQFTLFEIGKQYNCSRQRIAQVMEQFELPRRNPQRCHEGRHKHPHYATLEDYLAKRGKRKYDCPATLRRFLLPAVCEECGGNGYMHIHHLNYPATSRDDLQVLCASCHDIKHRNGLTLMWQSEIYNRYKSGVPTIELAQNYGVARITIYKVLNKVKNNMQTYRH